MDLYNEEYSDDDSSSCSGGELESYIREKYDLQDEGEASEDDFEAEMESQLEGRVKFLEQTTILKRPLPLALEPTPASISKKKSKDLIEYGEDSDSDPENLECKPTMSNDDLLYDPELDDQDQAWVDEQRKVYMTPVESKGRGGPKLPRSDAALNCPACMTLLCLDCQKHEIYHTQYRAMFVLNCRVDKNETVESREKMSSRKRQKNKEGSRLDQTEDIFHPVMCNMCGTEVAAFDKDEVYHFHNIIASHT